MVHKIVDGLKFLRSAGSFPVFYVNPNDLVNVGGEMIYRKGFGVDEENFNTEMFDRFFIENDYAPPMDLVSDIRVNRDLRVPGIEVFTGGSLWRNRGENYYLLVDSYGLDSGNSSQISAIMQKREHLNLRISKFLEQNLYSELKKSRRAYERKIVRLIEDNISRPERIFELRVLGKDSSYRLSYKNIDLSSALEKNVRLDIDWLLASRILGLYSVMRKSI